jgi:Lrp/AsnC family transcriptional regulator, leucine-responsive regulatory protein
MLERIPLGPISLFHAETPRDPSGTGGRILVRKGRAVEQALVDPASVGRGLRVFAGVRLMRHARADVVAFESAVIQLSEVIHTRHVTGNYDYLLQVEVADLSAYEDFHANRLAALPSVAAVTSYVTMKTLSAVTT